jgi:hypothetical protein
MCRLWLRRSTTGRPAKKAALNIVVPAWQTPPPSPSTISPFWITWAVR